MGLFTSKYKKMYEDELKLHADTMIDKVNEREILSKDLENVQNLLNQKTNELIDALAKLDDIPEYEEVVLSFENSATLAELKGFEGLKEQLIEQGQLEIAKELNISTEEETSFNTTTFTHSFKYFKLKDNGNN